MSNPPRNVKMARPGEQEAVRTTIVGGRPPGSGQDVGDIPRGVEVLVKKASVDPKFKKLLLEKRAAAAAEISLHLEPVEEAMLNVVPAAQLETIIVHTTVSPKLRPAFLGYAAAVMLAAVGTATLGCDGGPGPPLTEGIRPDRPEESEERSEEPDEGDQAQSEEGILDDFASAVSTIATAGGARPDVPDFPEPVEPGDDEQEAGQQKKPPKPEDHVTRGIKADRP